MLKLVENGQLPTVIFTAANKQNTNMYHYIPYYRVIPVTNIYVIVESYSNNTWVACLKAFLNQAYAGLRPACTWFSEIPFIWIFMCVYMCVCVHP